MTKVVRLSDYRKKETVAVLRELLVKASRGGIVGLTFNVAFKDGTHRTGFTGSYLADQGPEGAGKPKT